MSTIKILNKNNQVLVFGTFYDPKKNNFGGATVLCSDIRSYLSTLNNRFLFFDLQKSSYFIINILRILFCPILFLRYQKIFLMVSQNGFKFIYPYFYYFSKLFKTELILRVIGGDADLVFNRALSFLSLEAKLSQTSLVFFETKYLCEKYKNLGNIKWFPNSRQFPDLKFMPRPYSGKFIFVGRICKEKGIELILESFDNRLSGFSLDIYGVLEKGYVPPGSFYKYFRGPLPHSRLLGTLQQYDFMLLPSHFEGEGYPGIVLESFAASTPVIASKWRSIPEIVIDGETGLLVDPFDSNDLSNKILTIDDRMHTSMQVASFNLHKFFETETILKNHFLKYI